MYIVENVAHLFGTASKVLQKHFRFKAPNFRALLNCGDSLKDRIIRPTKVASFLAYKRQPLLCDTAAIVTENLT